MKTTQIPNLVSYLLGLFDTLVLLVAWPLGKKGCKGVDFTKVTLKDMAAKFWSDHSNVLRGNPFGKNSSSKSPHGRVFALRK